MAPKGKKNLKNKLKLCFCCMRDSVKPCFCQCGVWSPVMR